MNYNNSDLVYTYECMSSKFSNSLISGSCMSRGKSGGTHTCLQKQSQDAITSVVRAMCEWDRAHLARIDEQGKQNVHMKTHPHMCHLLYEISSCKDGRRPQTAETRNANAQHKRRDQPLITSTKSDQARTINYAPTPEQHTRNTPDSALHVLSRLLS